MRRPACPFGSGKPGNRSRRGWRRCASSCSTICRSPARNSPSCRSTPTACNPCWPGWSCNSESAQPREQLAFLLWPESIESQARTNLRQLLHHLRRALPAECCLPGGGQPQRAMAARPRLHHRRGGIRCRAGARGGRRQTRRCGWRARGTRRSRAPLPGRSAARPLRRLAPAQARTLPPPTGARAAPPGDAARRAARLSRCHPPRRTPGGAGSAGRGAPPGADPPARRQSRPRQRAARLSPVHAGPAARTGRGSGRGHSRAVRSGIAVRTARRRARGTPAHRGGIAVAHGGQAQGMGATAGMLARRRARRHASGADPGRAGNRQIPPGRGIVRMVLAPGGRGGARAMLLRAGPSRLRSHRRLAAVGAVERRVRATGPGATRGTGARDAGDSGASTRPSNGRSRSRRAGSGATSTTR